MSMTKIKRNAINGSHWYLPTTIGVLVCFLLTTAFSATSADEAEAIFDDSQVLTYNLTFSQPDWWDQLVYNFEQDPDQPYLEAQFEYDGQILDSIGVRFKGNSSYWFSEGNKKSFKLDFNEYDDEQRFYGLKKVNLNNSFKDPTMLREKLFYDHVNQRIPAGRANFVRLEINGEYWGLYVQVEQVDKTFFQRHIGGSEDGNLFKGEPHGSLEYLGPDPEPYYDHYELKTNETENDWTDLVNLIDVLNNTPTEDFPVALDAAFEVDNYLQALAANMLFVNLDSYVGTGHNYYVYHREDNDKFIHFVWDANEAFGNFNYGMNAQQIVTLNPHWLPFPPWSRPLCLNLWEVQDWDRDYLRHLAAGLRSDFNSEYMDTRIHELADLIRPAVYEDTNKMYSNEEFERNLDEDLNGHPHGTIIGLNRFVTERSAFLDTFLDQFASRSDLALNELMSVNTETITDGAGDFDPWLEIYNIGPGLVHVQDVYLTDDTNDPSKWALPYFDLDDGEFAMLWLDGETYEGADHASFSLDPMGGELHLYKHTGFEYELISTITYPALGDDVSYGQYPDGAGDWQTMQTPTPGWENEEDQWTGVVLYINEFMADNETTISDEYGEFDDWVEIFNPGDSDVDMGGLFMTDDLTEPTMWQVPAGVIVPAHGFLLIWADKDMEQGDTHAEFKLSADGEAVGLYASDGVTVIDSIEFGAQEPDISYGRIPDGGVTWDYLTNPTPGESNDMPGDCLALTVDNLIAGEGATFTITNGTPNETVAVLWSMTAGGFVYEGNGWCVNFGFDIPGSEVQSRIVVMGLFDEFGEFVDVHPIPNQALGLTVMFQAAEQNTCPDPCMSNLIEATVE